MTPFVAICEDENKISSELESYLAEIFKKLNIKHRIDICYTGEKLYAKLETGAHYDLIFLDIEFAKSNVNGIEVGRLIRDAYHNDMVSIVYISWHEKYSMQLFDIRPLNFLIKPLDYNRVEQVIRKYLKIAGLWSKDFTYKIGHEICKVQIKDIVYLESSKRKLILHLASGKKEEFYGTLKEAYGKQLQRFDFLFIHASYAVNYNYVATLKYDELTLSTNVTLPISQHRRKGVGEDYFAIVERRRV